MSGDVTDANGRAAGDGSAGDVSAGEAPDAFQALGDEARLSTLTALLAREDEPVPFSELQAATDVEPSARFAYHLRQLAGRYVEKVGGDGDGESESDDLEGYRLTYAGRKVARAVTAGTYTDSVDLEGVDLDADCPHCGDARLEARTEDNVVGVSCDACERPVLSLPFPPRGYRDRDPADVPAAFDSHHRHRLALLREGVCPECSGRVEGRVETPPEAGSERTGAADGARDGPTDEGTPAERVLATFECVTCGHGVRTPVTLTLLEHPAVVAFYHDHGEPVRDRPLWNVGGEWREAVLSRDPLAVVVSTRLEDELLELYVGGDASVVEYRRRPAAEGREDGEEDDASGTGLADRDAPDDEATPPDP